LLDTASNITAFAKVGVEGSNPFARSNDYQHIEKPSKNRLARQHRRLYPTKLLHNARSTVELSICERDENGRVDYYRPVFRSHFNALN